MWLTSPGSQHRLPTSGPLIGSNVVSPSATVRDHGVFIDQDLTMKTHLQQTASRCFATLRQLRSICRSIPTSVYNFLVSALVLSRLDYCNSLLIDLPLTHIQRLQWVQNAAARLIFSLRRCDHIIMLITILSSFIGLEWLITMLPNILSLLSVLNYWCVRHFLILCVWAEFNISKCRPCSSERLEASVVGLDQL